MNPVLTKTTSDYDACSIPNPNEDPTGPKVWSSTPDSMIPKNESTSITAIVSNATVQKFLQRSLHLAVDDLFASGTVQQLMESSLNQVTSFDTTHSGSYSSDNYDIRKVPISGDEMPYSPPNGGSDEHARKGPRLGRSKVCHQKSSIGVVLGSIWIRTSTLKAAQGSNTSSGELEVITSFIFYPASWLTKVGLRYGTEANLQWSATTGWKFNVAILRAVPENSLIFDMCREGNVKAIQLMLSRGDASLKDTSPKGWTPLHVGYS